MNPGSLYRITEAIGLDAFDDGDVVPGDFAIFIEKLGTPRDEYAYPYRFWTHVGYVVLMEREFEPA